MAIPRFTLLQLLGAMTVCGVLFCIAAIDPIGSTVALMLVLACMVAALLVSAVTYLVTRLVAEVAFSIFGRPVSPSPFGMATTLPQGPAAPVHDLATAVEKLTESDSNAEVLDAETPEENRGT